MPPMVWLVTGCTSGFGAQFILSILARGDKAIATGRDVSRMKHLEEAGAAVLQLDVGAEQAVLDAKVGDALKLYGRIDVLINNAGYTDVGYWEDTPYERVLAIFSTNTFGAMNLTRSLVPHFRQNGAGFVVFNSSYLAWYTFPGGSAYSGTKAAMGAMVEGLQKETASFGIKCLIMEPGSFRTLLMEKESAKFTNPMPEYEELTTIINGILASFTGGAPGDPKKAVEIVIDVVKQEGCAVGKAIPLRLPLGKDAAADIRAKCEETLKVLDEWKEVIESTDLDVQ